MSNTISGGIHFSGIGNGTDFSQIVDKLKEVESMPMKRLEAWKSDWNKRYEAFGEIIAATREAKENLAKLNSPQKFLAKLASSTNENAVTAKADANAVDGSHTIDVKQLASNSIWALKGSYASKSTSVNTSGAAQDFSYTYKGTTRTLSVAANTSLESFVNLVNQDKSNPGIKLSIVQTAGGYTFQATGKESGTAASLTIHPSNLDKMSGSGSVWTSNSTVDPTKPFNDGQTVDSYTYSYIMDDGNNFSVTLNGDMTQQDLADEINAKYRDAGGTEDIAFFRNTSTGGTTKALTVKGVKEVSTSINGGTPTTSKAKPTASTTITGSLNDALGTPGTAQTYTFTRADGTNETITLDGEKTKKDLLAALEEKGYKVTTSPNGSGTDISVSGLQSLAPFPDSTATGSMSGSLTDALGVPGTSKTYNFTKDDGSIETISLDGGKTKQDLLDMLDTMGYSVITKANGSGTDVSISGLKDISALPDYQSKRSWNWNEDASKYTSTTDTIQKGIAPKNLTFTFEMGDGSTKTVNTTSDKTLQDVMDDLNAQTGTTTAEIKDGKLVLNNVVSAKGYGISGQVTGSDAWAVRRSCDAEFYVDNWPQLMTSSTNEVKNVLEGVTLTLKDVGKAQISVAADSDSVKENIQTVLDAINSVIKKVQDLTKFDSEKETVDITQKKYQYGSQFSAEKGSVLTGNYGVQLFNSRLKSMTSGVPPGFIPAKKEGEIFTGDWASSLASIGIKTCSQEGNPNYGLLMIAPPASNKEMQEIDQENFDKAMSEHLDSVISFFSSDDVGSTSSPDFRYANHIKGMTKAGTYDVKYSVAADGKTTVFVNGVEAHESDIEAGTFTVGSDGGGASGLSVRIDNLAPGDYSGTVSIKQGKIREVEDFFDAELVFYEPDEKDPTIGQKNGALMILQDNYKKIMENIDKKLEREEERLTKWEKTQRLAFSRLETLLGQYERNSTQLSNQIAGLQ